MHLRTRDIVWRCHSVRPFGLAVFSSLRRWFSSHGAECTTLPQQHVGRTTRLRSRRAAFMADVVASRSLPRLTVMSTNRRPADIARRSAKALQARPHDAFRRETFALPRAVGYL